jgi:RNA polymerase sigma-70 factor (ECF subfamily)
MVDVASGHASRVTALGPSRAEQDATRQDAQDAPAGSVQLELLYRNEQRALVRFFTSYRASRDEASDLVQETFLRLARADFGNGGLLLRPAAYLRQIARNLLKDRAKAARRHHADAHVNADDVQLSGVDEHKRLEARDSLARLETAIRRLKPKTREIFLAHHLEGLSYAEVAARTGMSVSGIEKQIARAFDHIHRLTGLP